MRPTKAFAMILAFMVPLAAASAQPPEPMLGRGIDPANGTEGARLADAWSNAAQARFGVRLDYSGVRVGGSGIRLSTVADNAFGSMREDSSRRVGHAPDGAAIGTR